jgi:hypothetical protein
MTIGVSEERIRAMEDALSAPLLKGSAGGQLISRKSALASRGSSAAVGQMRGDLANRQRSEGTCPLTIEYRLDGISAGTIGGLSLRPSGIFVDEPTRQSARHQGLGEIGIVG